MQGDCHQIVLNLPLERASRLKDCCYGAQTMVTPRQDRSTQPELPESPPEMKKPTEGLEPSSSALRKLCSTIELHRLRDVRLYPANGPAVKHPTCPLRPGWSPLA